MFRYHRNLFRLSPLFFSAISTHMSDSSDKKTQDDKINNASSGSSKGAASGSEDPHHDPNFIEKMLKNLGLEKCQELIKNWFPDPPKHEKLLNDLTLEGVAKYIVDNKAKKIIVMTGAGVSTSAGIPDFRSPGTGLYDNLQKYNLPHPQAMFEINYFKENPEPFFALSKELFPVNLMPTTAHHFIKLLHDKGVLLKVYTQNIDSLDHIAGTPSEKIVEAHGSFFTSHCLSCHKEYNLDWMKEQIDKTLVPKCADCQNVVKPDVVFFGEALPSTFFNNLQRDFGECDLLIIMGTSLVVQPFASLIDKVGEKVPRLLINMEKAGVRSTIEKYIGAPGLDFDDDSNYRDVFWQGSCDDGAQRLAELLHWEKELNELKNKGVTKSNDTQGLTDSFRKMDLNQPKL